MPVSVPAVHASILDPRTTVVAKADYYATAAQLVDRFVANFAQSAKHVDEGVRHAGPRVTEPV